MNDARQSTALAGLKDFQLRTVNRVVDRFWGENPTRRFLVADEVGLGKTLVARGVVTKTIEHLRALGRDHITIVYICSNSQIAKQNLRRLHGGMATQIPYADRLTLLPRALAEMNRATREGAPANIISFTPGTSFSLRSRGGVVEERALLHQLIAATLEGYEPGPDWDEFFRCSAGAQAMANAAHEAAQQREALDVVSPAFRDALAANSRGGGEPLAGAVAEVAQEFEWHLQSDPHQAVPVDLSSRRYELLGELRHLLAQACAAQLRPDLVILDEFQRFSDLVHGDSEEALLAQQLLGGDTVDPAIADNEPRVLLLSATPFKMFTLPDEPEGEDHYKDFEKMVGSLGGAQRAREIREAMGRMRRALVAGDGEAAMAARDAAQGGLRQVMARTERVTVSGPGDQMFTDRDGLKVRLTAWDVRAYQRQAAIAQAVGGQDMLEYWRSSPYPLEFMESYKVKKNLLDQAPEVAAALGDQFTSRVSRDAIGRYDQVDLANPKLRWLADDVFDSGAAQVAWLPPSLPYYTPGGAFEDDKLQCFTKRLIFSSWAVAPKAIASMLSYEAERRLVEGAAGPPRDYFATRRSGLLTFARSQGRLTGMAALALLAPSASLARLGDPLRIAAEGALPLPLDRETFRATVRAGVVAALADLEAGQTPVAPGEDAHGPSLGPTAWYVLAPLLLDRMDDSATHLGDLRFGRGQQEADDSLFRDQVRAIDDADLSAMPAMPEDLVDVLTDLAIAGPGVCALRALHRTTDPAGEVGATDLRSAASRWAWSLRGVFNTPEVMLMLGAGGDGYWRAVLTHAVGGNLQAVLDEYAAVLDAAGSLGNETRERRLDGLAEAFADGSGLRAATQAVDFFDAEHGGHVDRFSHIRTHFAVRYGRQQSADSAAVQRESGARDAFNSPFWPFVLASTSVGQEGLDFHHYSHAVVHWNLPANPVDLEQREGRVHRFRGHAVRKNIGSAFRAAGERIDPDRNSWEQLFGWAATQRRDEHSEIFPDWVFPLDGGATVDRYVPALPMSREKQHYQRLLRTLGAYRLTLGQPRQQDMLAYLRNIDVDLDLGFDLSP